MDPERGGVGNGRVAADAGGVFDQDDDSDDLRAALEISLRPLEYYPVPEGIATNRRESQTVLSIGQETYFDTCRGEHELAVKERTSSKDNYYKFDCASFYQIMWDDSIATLNDKERWINEDISTSYSKSGQCPPPRPFPPESSPPFHRGYINSTSSVLENFTGYTLTNITNNAKTQQINQHKKPPNLCASHPLPHQLWGLTQKHGGPCGVLAAVQAEIIRLLVFGRSDKKRTCDEQYENPFNCADSHLFYPFCPSSLSNSEETNEKSNREKGKDQQHDRRTTIISPVTPSEVNQAMAMAIGMILARASVAPSASGNFSLEKGADKQCVRLVLPVISNVITDGEGKANLEGERPDGCCISLPYEAWILKVLNSSTKSASKLRLMTAEEASSSQMTEQHGFRVHTIYPQAPNYCHDSFLSGIKNGNGASPENKRQKKKEVTCPSEEENISADQSEMIALANAVANFLLGGDRNEEVVQQTQPSLTNGPTTPLGFFQRPGGVMFFVMSLVETRGVEKVRSDMDDPHTTLTSQFGHSSQELINLLLTGQAVSNVFDTSMTVSGDLICRGIQSRPAIGYLSQLESLRYCEVGGYYKSPIFPIWVVGSTSHFSVLFGDEHCLKERKSDLILEQCRRAFKMVEGGGENGFILSDRLSAVIDDLKLREKIGGDNGVLTLQAYLEVSGAGIILWDDFWKACSRLMTGSSLESIMDNDAKSRPPLLITQFGEGGGPCSKLESDNVTVQSTIESDEELAKKLAAEWGSGAHEIVDHSTKSDEDFARQLQAQWNAEVTGSSSPVGNSTQSPTPVTESKSDLKMGNGEASIASVETNSVYEAEVTSVTTEPVRLSRPQNFEFEKHGVSFPLYHYNGLRGGCLTPFRVTRLSPEEAVGMSIALTSRGADGAQHGGSGSVGSGDLEDVVRTKWPSCVFDWFGRDPPYID